MPFSTSRYTTHATGMGPRRELKYVRRAADSLTQETSSSIISVNTSNGSTAVGSRNWTKLNASRKVIIEGVNPH